MTLDAKRLSSDRRTVLVTACLTLVVSACTPALREQTVRQQAVERQLLPAAMPEGDTTEPWHIADRMRRYNVPGLSVAVIRNGRIDWSAGYGTTRAEGAQPVTESTVFQAASLSKPVAAVAALSLVSDGVLRLDEDVNERLRSWTLSVADNSAIPGTTLRGLLSHTAGVNVSGFPGYPPNEPRPTLLQTLNGTSPATSPRVLVERDRIGQYHYSGGGYQVLQLLIEQSTDVAFERVARERVLLPFGMTRSTFEVELPQELAVDAAAGHGYDGSQVAGRWLLYPQQAAASLWSTSTDLARFVLGILNAYSGRDTTVMHHDIAQQMLTRQAAGIGLGVGVHGEGKQLHFDHAGWTRGFRSYFVAYPARGEGVVIMANGDEGNLLIEEVVRSVSHVYDWPDFKSAARSVVTLGSSALNMLSGIYVVREIGLTLTVSAHDGFLRVRTPRGSMYTFYPSSERTFFAIEDGAALEIVTDADGRTELRLWGMVATRTGALSASQR